jgi:hypothetical protein
MNRIVKLYFTLRRYGFKPARAWAVACGQPRED